MAGNSASVHFDIGVVDTTPPVIALTGGDLTLAFGDTFADLGYAANDVVDGTVAVAVGGAVDISTAGEYTLTYDATDAAGNRAIQQTRIVTVFPVAEVAASPAPSGGNGAPVGLYGTINTVVPIGNAEQTAGNIGSGAGGEVLGAEAYRFTDAQVNALLEFLRAFGVDTALVDALGNALRSPQGDALRSISTLSLDTSVGGTHYIDSLYRRRPGGQHRHRHPHGHRGRWSRRDQHGFDKLTASGHQHHPVKYGIM